MKKIIFYLLSVVLLLASCSHAPVQPTNAEQETENPTQEQPIATATVQATSTEIEEDTMGEYQIIELLSERDGLSIYGQAYIPDNGNQKHPTVIMGHGFGGTHSNNEQYAAHLAAQGIASYVFDFTGGGTSSQSDGNTTDMSVISEVADMKAVYEQIKTLDFVNTDQLYLMGESQGGFVAALLAAQLQDEIAGLMLLYPAFVIPDDAHERFASPSAIPEQGTLWGVPLGSVYYTDIWDLDVYQEISPYTGDVLIFHGAQDGLVDISYSERAVKTYQSAELITYADAGHGFNGAQAEQTSVKMVEFINNHNTATATSNLLPEYQPLPSTYNQRIENGGTIERVDYSTDYNAQTYDKYALVYLPAGYDPSRETPYNIFYLMHGGSGYSNTFFGGEGQSLSLKNILDNMIANGDLEPLIVVTPTYYKGSASDDGTLTRDFHDELLNDLMPAIEGTYHTFAPTADAAGFQQSREHRAFGGFSMGSVTTWYTFINNLDSFKYFLPMSADSWVTGMMGGLNQANETAAYLSDVVQNSGYEPDDFFIYAITGTDDMTYANETAQIEAMKKQTDSFIFGRDIDSSNLYYYELEGGLHTYDFMNEYIYNVLPTFFSN